MGHDVPIWRQAINDKNHPLHRAAWTIFRERMSFKTVDRVLTPEKDVVIPFLITILDDVDLQLESSLGQGWAPIHALEIVGHWQVKEAIPRLLDIIADDDEENWDTIFHDRAIQALQQYDCTVKDELMTFAQTQTHSVKVTIASILPDVCPGDQQIFDFIVSLFNTVDKKEVFRSSFLAEMLLTHDTPKAIPVLEQRLNRHEFSRDEYDRIKSFLKEAREGKWNNWKD